MHDQMSMRDRAADVAQVFEGRLPELERDVVQREEIWTTFCFDLSSERRSLPIRMPQSAIGRVRVLSGKTQFQFEEYGNLVEDVVGGGVSGLGQTVRQAVVRVL